jgi:protein-disulfide isomerase-like protein with CxxC motif
MAHLIWALLAVVALQAYIIVNAARVVLAASKASYLRGRRTVHAEVVAKVGLHRPELDAVTGGDVARARLRAATWRPQ